MVAALAVSYRPNCRTLTRTWNCRTLSWNCWLQLGVLGAVALKYQAYRQRLPYHRTDCWIQIVAFFRFSSIFEFFWIFGIFEIFCFLKFFWSFFEILKIFRRLRILNQMLIFCRYLWNTERKSCQILNTVFEVFDTWKKKWNISDFLDGTIIGPSFKLNSTKLETMSDLAKWNSNNEKSIYWAKTRGDTLNSKIFENHAWLLFCWGACWICICEKRSLKFCCWVTWRSVTHGNTLVKPIVESAFYTLFQSQVGFCMTFRKCCLIGLKNADFQTELNFF